MLAEFLSTVPHGCLHLGGSVICGCGEGRRRMGHE